MKLLVTGGAGFIGSNFVRYILREHREDEVVVLDKLTYAGNPENLVDLKDDPRFRFVQGDICDPAAVDPLVAGVDAVVNFAAETHVDRSILDAGAFVQTDVYGTWVLLEAVRRHRTPRFLQVSTDEVYGEVPEGASREDSPLAPRSPYAASKAGGELLIRSYVITHGVPAIVTRGSNTIGPYQYPEKVVPLFITNALDGLPLPIYGEGKAVRDYVHVEDHCAAIDLALRRGEPGDVFNVGGGNEVNTVQLAEAILRLLDRPRSLMQFVPDRPGHDMRYCLDCSRIHALGWKPRYDFEQALARTVEWYVQNEAWWRKIKSGDYLEYYQRNYGDRAALLSR